MSNKILPVLCYPGSKWGKAYKGKPDGWKIDLIISALNIKANDKFLDMFGGSGIVGVNVKHLTKCNVIINDFDNMFPITNHKAIKNKMSFQGMFKNFTKEALEKFITAIKNGYWEKLKKYNNILSDCKIIDKDWVKPETFKAHVKLLRELNLTKIYVDPPYIQGLYKGSFNNLKHKKLRNLLNELKNSKIKILISYDNKPFIINLYKDWYITQEEFQYQTGKLNRSGQKKQVKKLLITNFKVKNNEKTRKA